MTGDMMEEIREAVEAGEALAPIWSWALLDYIDELHEKNINLRYEVKVDICSCSSLSTKTDHRCRLHPKNRARTMDQRYDFEHAWDAHYEEKRDKNE